MFRSQFPRNTSPLKEFFKPSSRRLIASFTTPLRASHPQPNRGTRLSLPQRLPRRWVTTDAEAATEGDRRAAETSSEATKNASEPTQKQEQQSEIENPLQKDLDAKNREIIGLKDSYLRQVADFRNLQERTRRDMDSARQFAIQRFATDLLESIDNLDRALSAVPPDALLPPPSSAPANKDLTNLHSGLQMTSQILMQTLKKHGLERFDPTEGEGRKFNPITDEATFMTKAEGKEDGDVLMTQSKGFMLNGRVLRPAKVGVVRNL